VLSEVGLTPTEEQVNLRLGCVPRPEKLMASALTSELTPSLNKIFNTFCCEALPHDS